MAHKFTVILKRPEWCADRSSCVDTILVHVAIEVDIPKHAAYVAKWHAWEADNSGPDGLDEEPEGSPEDYFCIAAYEGHLTPVYGD